VPFIIGAAVGAAAGAIVGTAPVIGGAPPAPSGSGRLRIEPDQVDAAIAVFKGALASLETEVIQARSDIYALAPAYDDVSQNAAAAFNQAGYAEANSAVVAWEGAVLQLRSIIEQLEASKLTNVNADGESASFLRPPG